MTPTRNRLFALLLWTCLVQPGYAQPIPLPWSDYPNAEDAEALQNRAEERDRLFRRHAGLKTDTLFDAEGHVQRIAHYDRDGRLVREEVRTIHPTQAEKYLQSVTTLSYHPSTGKVRTSETHEFDGPSPGKPENENLYRSEYDESGQLLRNVTVFNPSSGGPFPSAITRYLRDDQGRPLRKAFYHLTEGGDSSLVSVRETLYDEQGRKVLELDRRYLDGAFTETGYVRDADGHEVQMIEVTGYFLPGSRGYYEAEGKPRPWQGAARGLWWDGEFWGIKSGRTLVQDVHSFYEDGRLQSVERLNAEQTEPQTWKICHYDAMGRLAGLITYTAPGRLGTIELFGWDAEGRKASRTEISYGQYRVEVDWQKGNLGPGDLLEGKRGLEKEYRYGYDAGGNLTSISFDTRMGDTGHRTRHTEVFYPDGRMMGLGFSSSSSDATESEEWTWEYDARRMLSQVREEGGRIAERHGFGYW